MALVKDRNLSRLLVAVARPEWARPVAAGFSVYRLGIAAVCQDGTLVPAGAANPPSPIVAILGLAEHQQINTAYFPGSGAFVGGDTPVKCFRGTWAIPFDAAPTWASIGKPVYAVDDETVSLTQTPDGGTARLQVGILSGFDERGVPYVEI